MERGQNKGRNRAELGRTAGEKRAEQGHTAGENRPKRGRKKAAKKAAQGKSAPPRLRKALPLFCLISLFFLCFIVDFQEKSLPADSTQLTETTPKAVALTFDDGPKPSTTAPLLDGLAQRGVKATFFLIGQQLTGNEELVRRMDTEGHQIGLHSLHHVKLQGLNQADLAEELGRERAALRSLLGREDFWLRPPYGLLDDALKQAVDCPIILWSVDPEDWNRPDAERVTQHILTHAQDGDIILLHDIYPESVDAALAVIDALHEEGYVFLTVEELLLSRGISPAAGKVFRKAP